MVQSLLHFCRCAKIPIDRDFIKDRSTGQTSPDLSFDNRLIGIPRPTQLISLIRETISNMYVARRSHCDFTPSQCDSFNIDCDQPTIAIFQFQLHIKPFLSILCLPHQGMSRGGYREYRFQKPMERFKRTTLATLLNPPKPSQDGRQRCARLVGDVRLDMKCAIHGINYIHWQIFRS